MERENVALSLPKDLIERLIKSGQGSLSIQVLSEFYVTGTRKIPIDER